MSFIIYQPKKTLALASLGFLIRLAVIATFKDQIRQRFEVVTPIGSWKRAYEAVHLWNSGLNPYSGNIFHEYPISLQFYKIIVAYFNVDLAFVGTDIVIAMLLKQSAFNQLILDGKTEEVAISRSMKVFLIYLFSPITVLSCAGASTSIFTNFLIAVISYILPMKPFRALTCVLCAFLACNNIHYVTLVLPLLLCLEYCSNSKKQNSQTKIDSHDQHSQVTNNLSYYQRPDFLSSLSASVIIFATTVVTLISTSYLLMGNSWAFMNSTYLFVLRVQDLTPNIGMFWYFFTEMFEQFLDFFTWTVQINAFIHALPISICLRDNPFFALYIMILTSTIFQPYPSLANIGIITSLLPQWLDLVDNMKRGLIVYCASSACLSLLPVFWHLWIMMGTANSNFYFGATLAFSASFILFMIDLLNAYSYTNAKIRYEQISSKNKRAEFVK